VEERGSSISEWKKEGIILMFLSEPVLIIFGGSQAFMGSENGLINTYLGRGSKI
jgi:hypothetical protein